MKVKINNKEVELKFCVKFVRELDKVAGLDVNGASFGMGLTKSIPALNTADPAVLADVIYSATSTNKAFRPSQDDVDNFIDDYDGDLEKLFDDVTKEMSAANAIKVALKNAQA
ncbi:tail assembly chaperone [Leuconostoc gasicomitatum]|uniref:tail assembly chaperone n=1 Tax=Leuconostoc gasicomitatum TaxID=115778 RepID=UPI001CC5E1A6|nr:tail assembly chaperone [Leuconostoc gasicomitatum]MBZ5949266.1 tail assembly chaperone [Leuconostoc gasicomitatum]